MDYVEQREQRGEIRGPVVAQDADMDGEGVGAQGKGVGAARCCDCFAEFTQGGEDGF